MLIFLFGCQSKPAPETVAIICWVNGAQDSFLFEIMSDDTVKAFCGNVFIDFEAKKSIIGEDVKTKTFSLNKEKSSSVNKLLQEIGSKKPGYFNPGNDSKEIFALINEECYWSSADYPGKLSNLTDLMFEYAKWEDKR